MPATRISSPDTSVVTRPGADAALITLLFFAFLSYRIRPVGPLVLAFSLISLLGAIVALSLLYAASTAADSPAAQGLFMIGAALGLSDGAIVTLFVVLGIAFFGLLGWLCIRQIASRYERQKANDLSLTTDSLWFLFGSMQAPGIALTGPAWILAAAAGFAVYKNADADSPARTSGGNRIRLIHLGNASGEDLNKLTARPVEVIQRIGRARVHEATQVASKFHSQSLPDRG